MQVTRGDVLGSLDIGANAFVVEVGGGHRPFGRADLILEKYPFEEAHRSFGMVYGAPVLIADAMRLPIPNRGCDVIFASHVVEHLPEPDRFLMEVKRCAEWVYLEFPSLPRELMFAWSFHEWWIEARGTHLIFHREDIPQLFGDLFHRQYDFLFDAWCMQRHRLLNSWVWCRTADLTWEFSDESAFEHALASSARGAMKVNSAPPDAVEYTWRQIGVLALQKLLPRRALDGLVARWRKRRRGEPRPVSQALVDRLMCLRCETSHLRLQGDEIVCGTCGEVYRQRNGLFDFDPPLVDRVVG